MTTPQRARLHPRPGDSGLQLLGSRVHAQPPAVPGCCSQGLSPLRRPGPRHPRCLCLELNKSAFGFSPSSVCVFSSVGRKRGRGQIEPGELSLHPQTYPLPLLPLRQLPSGLLLSRNPSNFRSLPSLPPPPQPSCPSPRPQSTPLALLPLPPQTPPRLDLPAPRFPPPASPRRGGRRPPPCLSPQAPASPSTSPPPAPTPGSEARKPERK